MGSNHTGKAPDQEHWAGEGVFYGLATAIKFPSNFSRAPYTLIATGVFTLPQRVEMPFSLINSPGSSSLGISPAFNEIMPAWVLSDNYYMVLRSETKFGVRGEAFAKASGVKYENEVLRPDIIDMLIAARADLLRCAKLGGGPNVIYTSKDIPGIGKNYMTEASRQKAVTTYSRFILYYCLRTLWRALRAGSLTGNEFASTIGTRAFSSAATASSLTETIVREGQWLPQTMAGAGALMLGHSCAPRTASFLGSLRKCLVTLADMEDALVETVLASKRKDDKRGPRIIDDYSDAHIAAEHDKVVSAAVKEAKWMRSDIHGFFSRI